MDIASSWHVARLRRRTAAEMGRRGVLKALRRALGHQVLSPITSTALDSVPTPAQILSESMAARTEFLGHTPRTVQLDYARGVYEALTSVTGHREHPPTAAPGR